MSAPLYATTGSGEAVLVEKKSRFIGALAHTETEEEARRLYRALREVLAEAVELGGSTLSDQSYRQPDGLPGGFQTRHAVYGREGLPCPACGAG